MNAEQRVRIAAEAYVSLHLDAAQVHQIRRMIDMSVVERVAELEADLKVARETNTRLNLRCQKAESDLIHNRFYDRAWGDASRYYGKKIRDQAELERRVVRQGQDIGNLRTRIQELKDIIEDKLNEENA